jgi:mannose-6-phosphate isomerase-like protein (cupin superfamily)
VEGIHEYPENQRPAAFSRFADTFSPKIVADLNGQQVKLVRAEGDKVPWHTHEKEDEVFPILEGVLDVIRTEGQTELDPLEFIVIPKGVARRGLEG